MALTQIERKVLRKMFAEADALSAEAASLPRWRWFARWRRLDKANTIRKAAGSTYQWWMFQHFVEDAATVVRDLASK